MRSGLANARGLRGGAEIAWMLGVGVAAWLTVTVARGDAVHPEALFGLLGPLASACVTWLVIERTWRAAPERLTGVMIAGFAIKLVFFGLYVAAALRLLALRPVPFVTSFVVSFIGLYAMQALFLSRLTMPRSQ
jgi:hypothetical protein